MHLLENLDELMKRNKLNRTELAKEIGIAPSTINSWYSRSCENITIKTLMKVANYFNVSVEELVHDTPEKELTFSTADFSEEELQAIYVFSEFLKKNRIG